VRCVVHVHGLPLWREQGVQLHVSMSHMLTALSPAHITGDVARIGCLRAQQLRLRGAECTDHEKHMIADGGERKGDNHARDVMVG
jgi:hypothetical protein